MIHHNRRIISHHYPGYRTYIIHFHVIIEIRIFSSIKKIHVSLFFQDFSLKSHVCGPVISEDFSVLFLHLQLRLFQVFSCQEFALWQIYLCSLQRVYHNVFLAMISLKGGKQRGQFTGTRGSPHIIPECMAGWAPPANGNVVLPALSIINPDIGPGHMLLPCPGISGNREAVIRAERACTHTTNPCGDGTINFLTGGFRRYRKGSGQATGFITFRRRSSACNDPSSPHH